MKEAYQAALKRISVREYSTGELHAYLLKKGFSEEDIAQAIAELVRLKFVDDERYARVVVRYQAGRGKGPAYIRQKLKQKGVNASTAEIKRWLPEVSEKTELQSAREVVERRYPEYRNDRATAVKAMQALLRRGFSYDVARQAVSGAKLDEF